MTRPQLLQTVLDTTDPRALAEFYRQLLGLEYRPGDEPREGEEAPDWLVLRTAEGTNVLAFQLDEDLVASTWPDGEVPMQAHLDLTVPDLAALSAARDHALELGGTIRFDRTDDPDEPLYVIADPAGHPFCIFVA